MNWYISRGKSRFWHYMKIRRSEGERTHSLLGVDKAIYKVADRKDGFIKMINESDGLRLYARLCRLSIMIWQKISCLKPASLGGCSTCWPTIPDKNWPNCITWACPDLIGWCGVWVHIWFVTVSSSCRWWNGGCGISQLIAVWSMLWKCGLDVSDACSRRDSGGFWPLSLKLSPKKSRKITHLHNTKKQSKEIMQFRTDVVIGVGIQKKSQEAEDLTLFHRTMWKRELTVNEICY